MFDFCDDLMSISLQRKGVNQFLKNAQYKRTEQYEYDEEWNDVGAGILLPIQMFHRVNMYLK